MAPKAQTAAGFTQTCWRGLCIGHPADWEEARLSGYEEPNRLALVDRRFQRLEAKWQKLSRPPDLGAMYEKLKKSFKDQPSRPLSGHPDWQGLVQMRPDSDSPDGGSIRQIPGQVVHAGRFFAESGILVQVVLTWPEKRDRPLEKAILDSCRPQGPSAIVNWQALGLQAAVGQEFELTSATSRVGRICWTFHRKKPNMELTIERLAMGKFWLKGSLEQWLNKELPHGFKPAGGGLVTAGAHKGQFLNSRLGGRLAGWVHRAQRRLDWAWICPVQERVYRLTLVRRTTKELSWPAGIWVHCCEDAKIGGDCDAREIG